MLALRSDFDLALPFRGDQAAATEAERRFVELTGTGFTANAALPWTGDQDPGDGAVVAIPATYETLRYAGQG